jgi:hypothetical protein
VLANLSSDATLTNATGTTACFKPLNSPFVTFATAGLAAGASKTVTLDYDDPTQGAIAFTPQVAQGVAH